MKKFRLLPLIFWTRFAVCALAMQIALAPSAFPYTVDYSRPGAGGCPVANRQNLASGAPPLARQWSTSLPNTSPATILTAAPDGSAAQLSEIADTINAAYSIWTGVTGTTLSASNFPGALGPLNQTPVQNACTPDSAAGSTNSPSVDGINTICFNQSSAAFTTGVLSFTRIFVANAPGETVGSAAPAIFPGQIIDADVYFRNDGQASFATPAALPNSPGAYDLESLLAHELGHVFGLDHSGVWRALMFPFAPPPGSFFGERPSASAPDAPLSDDDRTGLRALYLDPASAASFGFISGRVLPANPFALATFAPAAPGEYVAGIFGAQAVAVDAPSGSVVAATLSGWTCSASDGIVHFDGSYTLGPLPLGRSYTVYAEPFSGIVQPSDIANSVAGVCSASGANPCALPAINTNFAPHQKP